MTSSTNHIDLIKVEVTNHLSLLGLCQLRRLCVERLEKEELVAVLTDKMGLEEAQAIAPTISVIKQRIYKALGVTTTKEVKQAAIDLGWITSSTDMRCKANWLKIQEKLQEKVARIFQPQDDEFATEVELKTLGLRELRKLCPGRVTGIRSMSKDQMVLELLGKVKRNELI